MTEREQEISYEEAARQADAVEAMYPGVSASRDMLSTLIVGVDSTGAYQSGRHIHAEPQWSTAEQRVPDLRLTVYDESEQPTTRLVARYDGEGYKTVDHLSGAEVDTTEVVEQTKRGVELFAAYRQLPLKAKAYVAASKVYDASRSAEDMREMLVESGAKAIAALFRDDDLQNLSPAKTFAFIRYAIQDLAPNTNE